jgi:hypothetical protein
MLCKKKRKRNADVSKLNFHTKSMQQQKRSAKRLSALAGHLTPVPALWPARSVLVFLIDLIFN